MQISRHSRDHSGRTIGTGYTIAIYRIFLYTHTVNIASVACFPHIIFCIFFHRYVDHGPQIYVIRLFTYAMVGVAFGHEFFNINRKFSDVFWLNRIFKLLPVEMSTKPSSSHDVSPFIWRVSISNVCRIQFSRISGKYNHGSYVAYHPHVKCLESLSDDSVDKIFKVFNGSQLFHRRINLIFNFENCNVHSAFKYIWSIG